ncbi:hypothetical protein AC578_3272 [Pseudocercospora eumusae]|uniref:Uncharacterized protein n=1 Tax=Pseudocercospora eumusae TaxID=321146 RepID=A0A139GZD8_9PEZI|nr:hypothetical protein AC578_3272 [Pseudocercospora eumusae]
MGNAMRRCRAELRLKFVWGWIAGERLDVGIVDVDAEASVDGRATDPSKKRPDRATGVEGELRVAKQGNGSLRADWRLAKDAKLSAASVCECYRQLKSTRQQAAVQRADN